VSIPFSWEVTAGIGCADRIIRDFEFPYSSLIVLLTCEFGSKKFE
jgi:hypothetical protein